MADDGMVIHFCQRGTGLGNTASMGNHNDRLCDLYNSFNTYIDGWVKLCLCSDHHITNTRSVTKCLRMEMVSAVITSTKGTT